MPSTLPRVKVKLLTKHYCRLKSPVLGTMSDSSFALLKQIFTQESVQWAQVNTVTKSVLILFSGVFQPRKLQRTVFESESGHSYLSSSFRGESARKVLFSRVGDAVTNWEFLHQIPGRIRLHHPLLLKRSTVCTEIETAVSNTVGVRSCSARSLTGNVVIEYDPECIALSRLLIIADTVLSGLPVEERKEDARRLGPFEIATASLGATLLLPEALFLTVPMVLSTGLPIFKKALIAVRQKKIKVDILDTVVIGGCLAASQVPVAAFMVWAVALADKMHDRTSQSTGKLLKKIFGTQPRFAWKKTETAEVQVPIIELTKGDVVVAHTGEAIPVDGVVADGKALVDQSALTGESQPVERRAGEQVFSATTVLSGELSIRVEMTGKETVAGKIQQIVTEASNHKTKMQSTGERIADHAVLPTLALGGLGLAIGGPSTSLAVVNADFGTGIRVAAPTLLLSHLIRLAKHGILVKKGEALEKLAKADVFIFDKTGTLTEELPVVTTIIPLGKLKVAPEILLRYAATAEQRVSHPIGRAIVAEATRRGLPLPSTGWARIRIGLGVEMDTEGKTIHIGSCRFLEEERIPIPQTLVKRLERTAANGEGAVVVAIDHRVAGLIQFKTVPRKETQEVIRSLRARGVKKVVLLSGDRCEITKRIASEIGADAYHAEVLPQEKVEYVQKYKQAGAVVVMVGDGVNDAPALTTADISISLKGASDVAVDTADIIFLDGNFAKMHLLFDSAHHFHKGVWSNFRLIAIPNALCIIGALTRFWGLGASLVLNNCFNILATAKSLTPLYSTLEQSEKKPHGALPPEASARPLALAPTPIG